MENKEISKKRYSKSQFQINMKKCEDLTSNEITKMYEIYSPHHNVDFESFKTRSINSFTEFGIYEFKETKEIIGFSGVRINQFKLNKQKTINTIYFGSMFIKEEYRGISLAPAHCLKVCIRERFEHFFGKVILWGDSISYKSFISIQNNCKEVYPSITTQMTPFLSSVRDELGEMYYGENYSKGTGIVIKKEKRVKDHVAEITEKDLENKHIKYYTEINPGYKEGHGVILVIPINMTNIFSVIMHITQKSFGKKKHKSHVKTINDAKMENKIDSKLDEKITNVLKVSKEVPKLMKVEYEELMETAEAISENLPTTINENGENKPAPQVLASNKVSVPGVKADLNKEK